MDTSSTDAKAHWEEHYGERDRVWSGRVNARLAEVVSTLEPGRALDLGCGEGGDACWLAERGWTVVAVDISDTALQRAAADADARGLGDRIEFAQQDLSDGFPDGTFDLIGRGRRAPQKILREGRATLGRCGRFILRSSGARSCTQRGEARESCKIAPRDIRWHCYLRACSISI